MYLVFYRILQCNAASTLLLREKSNMGIRRFGVEIDLRSHEAMVKVGQEAALRPLKFMHIRGVNNLRSAVLGEVDFTNAGCKCTRNFLIVEKIPNSILLGIGFLHECCSGWNFNEEFVVLKWQKLALFAQRKGQHHRSQGGRKEKWLLLWQYLEMVKC